MMSDSLLSHGGRSARAALSTMLVVLPVFWAVGQLGT